MLNEKEKMIIGVTGYGASGASAYVDLIKEFNNVQSFDAAVEFQLLQEPDGIVDLEYYLVYAGRRLSTNSAIRRFSNNICSTRNNTINRYSNGAFRELSREYLESFCSLHWSGHSNHDPIDLQHWANRAEYSKLNSLVRHFGQLFNKSFRWPPLQDRFFSFVDKEEFDEKTKRYLYKLLEKCGFSIDAPILLEQVFNPSRPLLGMDYFDNPKSIIVDRDPRDIYLLTNYYYKQKGINTGFMPDNSNVEQFVEYYRALHKNHIEDSRVLYVRFEDLIYKYSETVHIVQEWLGLEHIKKHVFFKPECSINNTRAYLRYSNHSTEIEYIKKNLSEFLYPFEDAEKNLEFVPENIKPFDRQSDAWK